MARGPGLNSGFHVAKGLGFLRLQMAPASVCRVLRRLDGAVSPPSNHYWPSGPGAAGSRHVPRRWMADASESPPQGRCLGNRRASMGTRPPARPPPPPSPRSLRRLLLNLPLRVGGGLWISWRNLSLAKGEEAAGEGGSVREARRASAGALPRRGPGGQAPGSQLSGLVSALSLMVCGAGRPNRRPGPGPSTGGRQGPPCVLATRSLADGRPRVLLLLLRAWGRHVSLGAQGGSVLTRGGRCLPGSDLVGEHAIQLGAPALGP